MNEPSDPRSRLVAEAFGDDWDAGPASVFARRAAAAARRRRRLRHVLAAGSAAGVVLLGVWVATRPATLPPAEHIASPRPSAASAYEVLSDEEFLAEFRGRPLLILPEEPMAKRFVFLGR